jgi:hypothetical protein
MRFRLSNEPSTIGLGQGNPQVSLEISLLQDVARRFDRPRQIPYVERNFRAYSVPLNSQALL